MATATMNGLAWAALVTRWEPEADECEAQHGAVKVHRLDEPTLEIIAHDLEAERWEDASEFLALAIDEMFEQAEREATVRDITEALADIEEDTIKAEQLTIPEAPGTIIEAFEAHGAEFEPSHDGRYAVATCGRCQHKAAGPLHLVTDAMEEHATTHGKAKAEPAKQAKPRCKVHGVWAREDDGRCKRCDKPTNPAADELMAALREAIEAARTANPERIAQVKQEVATSGPAKLTLGVRGNGLLARRSAHTLAQATGKPQHELAKLTADEARALVLSLGIDAEWVPAASL